MSATNTCSVLKSLEIDSARVESLSEADLCELIGFIEYDNHLHAPFADDLCGDACDDAPPVMHATLGVRSLADASWRE